LAVFVYWVAVKVIGVRGLNDEFQNLDFIDLLSERHVLLRKIAENLWNDSSDINISNSEWYIIARIYKKQPTISYISKNLTISRQATHKFIRSLETKGLVEIKSVENNKRDKCLQLTVLGEECYETYKSLKGDLERKISESIGSENLTLIKDILKLDWGL